MSDYPTIKPDVTKADLDHIKKWYGEFIDPLLRVKDANDKYIGLIDLKDAYKVIVGIGFDKWIDNVLND